MRLLHEVVPGIIRAFLGNAAGRSRNEQVISDHEKIATLAPGPREASGVVVPVAGDLRATNAIQMADILTGWGRCMQRAKIALSPFCPARAATEEVNGFVEMGRVARAVVARPGKRPPRSMKNDRHLLDRADGRNELPRPPSTLLIEIS